MALPDQAPGASGVSPGVGVSTAPGASGVSPGVGASTVLLVGAAGGGVAAFATPVPMPPATTTASAVATRPFLSFMCYSSGLGHTLRVPLEPNLSRCRCAHAERAHSSTTPAAMALQEGRCHPTLALQQEPAGWGQPGEAAGDEADEQTRVSAEPKPAAGAGPVTDVRWLPGEPGVTAASAAHPDRRDRDTYWTVADTRGGDRLCRGRGTRGPFRR